MRPKNNRTSELLYIILACNAHNFSMYLFIYLYAFLNIYSLKCMGQRQLVKPSHGQNRPCEYNQVVHTTTNTFKYRRTFRNHLASSLLSFWKHYEKLSLINSDNRVLCNIVSMVRVDIISTCTQYL